MTSPIYFQWQNEFMLKTIYPLREMKLRDFLSIYYEVDQWAVYKNKTIADLQGEVQAYLQEQERLRGEAYDTYQSLTAYFTSTDVAANYQPRYPQLDPPLLNYLVTIHSIFQRYFPTYHNPVKENYFITIQIPKFEQLYKDTQKEIGAIQRRIRCRVATWPDRPKNEQRQALLENVSLKVIDEELTKLRQFLAASTKIQQRRQELYKWQAQQLASKNAITIKLNQRQADVSKLDAQHQQITLAVQRIQSPTLYDDLKAYFLKLDVTEDMRKVFPNLDMGFMYRVNTLHQQFKLFPAAEASQKYFVNNLLNTYTTNWRAFTGISGQMASAELQKLQDFVLAIDLHTKPPDQAKIVVQQRDAQRVTLETQLNQAKADVQSLQGQLSGIDNALNTPEKQLFTQNFTPAEVSVADITRAKVEDYNNQLLSKSHTELLQMIVQRFLDEPTRFPIWLQYMVIHFSGMRYQSAHGSWADPRDLLSSLTEKDVEQEIKAMDESMIEEMVRGKLTTYQSASSQPGPLTQPASVQQPGIPTQQPMAATAPARAAMQPAGADLAAPPALAITTDAKWKAKALSYIDRLTAYRSRYKVTPADKATSAVVYKDSAGVLSPAPIAPLLAGDFVLVDTLPIFRDGNYFLIQSTAKPGYVGMYISEQDLSLIPDSRKRKVLLDLRVDEENYDIDQETDAQVLDDLRAMKEREGFPAWMWNEIVKLTDLRLTEVQSANWEQASDEEQADRLAYKWREYNNLMNKWKQANLTGWREENDLTSKLVVTRAVCNEVAEHCQHIRGNSPPGGLTAKPTWYQRLERNPKLQAGVDKPYLRRIKSTADLKKGSSILWLEFVYDEPNAWRIAHPLKLSSGEGLLTPPLNVPHGDGGSNQFDPKKGYIVKSASSWNYFQDSQGRYKRSRSVTTADGKGLQQVQWLRWIHEATIVDCVDTPDGPTLLTFETALPYEDKRRSTIGVFRHPANWVLYNVTGATFMGSFAGYTPEGAVPYNEMREMLNWNHILLNDNFMTPAQMQDFYNKAGYQFTRDLDAAVRQSQVETMPVLKKQAENHSEMITVYDVDPLARTAKPYVPEVPAMSINVPRGTRMFVSDPVQVGADRFYRVVSCEYEPRLQDYYVKSVDLIASPETTANKAFAVKTPLFPLQLKYADAQGLPVFEAASQLGQLTAGTRLLASAVQKVIPGDPGDGTTHDASGKRYVLVVECPDLSEAAGYFVQLDSLLPISMDDYVTEATGRGAAILQQISMRITPGDNSNQAVLYKIDNQVASKSGIDSLPRDALLTTAASPQFVTNMDEAFYRIEACASKPAYVGLYINVEDITLVIDQ